MIDVTKLLNECKNIGKRILPDLSRAYPSKSDIGNNKNTII